MKATPRNNTFTFTNISTNMKNGWLVFRTHYVLKVPTIFCWLVLWGVNDTPAISNIDSDFYLSVSECSHFFRPLNLSESEGYKLGSAPSIPTVQANTISCRWYGLCLPRKSVEALLCWTIVFDVAEFLLRKHHASIHTKDMDGIDPFQMVQVMAK